MLVKSDTRQSRLSTKRPHFSTLTVHTIVVCVFLFLYQPTLSFATTIHLHQAQTANTITSFILPPPPVSANKSKYETAKEVFLNSNENRLEPDILKVYKALFKETWLKSPEIQVARRLQEQKSSEKYTAWAKRLSPQVDLEISQKRFFNKDLDPDDPDQETQLLAEEAAAKDDYKDGEDLTDWQFDMDIPVYKRTLSLAIDIAELEHDMADNNLTIKTRELDSKLHELLANYMVACYKLLNLENSIIISSEHVEKIQRGYDLRDQTKLALLRAQANLKELEARKDLNEQRRDSTFRELLDYTAIPEFNPLMQDFLAESTSDENLRNFFMDNSLLYKKIILERDLGKSKAKKYTQAEWPSLFVRGELDRKDDTRLEDYSGEGSIGLVLSVPLFSGGTIFSNIKTKDMAAQIASIQEHSSVLRTFNSIANKKKSITSLQSVFQKQLIHLQQQQEIVILSLKSYKIKQTSMQDLLTSKNRLIDAKNLLMRTTADLGILLRQFAWELGTPFAAPVVVVPE